MDEFNELFASIIIILKAFALFHVYFFVLVTLNISDSLSFGIYITIAAQHIVKISYLLLTMASAYTESQCFKISWSKSVAYLTESQKHQLRLIQPFAFKPGNLYAVKPSTILTFFSVMTTHTIVILQIHGNGTKS
jgi:hypothetical protein